MNAAGEKTPGWLLTMSWVCTAIYTFELALRFHVERRRIIDSAWNWLDIFVVVSAIASGILDIFDHAIVSFAFLRIFRCFRLLRLFKAFALTNQLSELRKLVRGIVSCLKTLFWSLILVLIWMTLWSTLAVELLHPIMEEVSQTTGVDAWKDCPRCSKSFKTVMASNLTFFQTIIAGDSWGLVAIPVIEKYPWAAVIFVGSLFSLIVGILNLIVAVLVDTAAEARSKDLVARAVESKDEEIREKRELQKMFLAIDVDNSGALTYDELEDAAQTIKSLTRHFGSWIFLEMSCANFSGCLTEMVLERLTRVSL
jgi:hypothetical protein